MHALSSAVTSTDKEVPGLLEVLAQVPDPRRKRGRPFRSSALSGLERETLQRIYRSITRDYELVTVSPSVEYHPEASGWRRRRYAEPASSWNQGLAPDKLRERLGRFFIVLDLDRRPRLATKEDFKAEFDRVLASGVESEKRLGVLVNPLLGFTPLDKPVTCAYWRCSTCCTAS